MSPTQKQQPFPRIPLTRAILRWYRRHGRSLPWRTTRDPYRILVSEVMLQQTQADRVRDAYPRFLRRFPSLAALARAALPAVIRAWRGMGYNNRAVRLYRLARLVTAQYGGRLPASIEELERLPGVGPYTARAVACFAFGRRTAVVDTNVRRVLLRWTGLRRIPADLQGLADRMLPAGSTADWNQALMDLGATVCRAHRPLCGQCPAARHCRSAHRISRIPSSPKAKRIPEPSRDGVPRRIYRGRIVDHLRRARRGAFVSAGEIGNAVKKPFRAGEVRWLESLLRGLQRDGLLDLRTRRGRIEARLARR